MRGWAITGWASVAVASIAATVVVAGGASEASFHAAIRVTARTSLALFLLAFTASSARRLVPSAATAWLSANRRYVGVSFAVSHLFHLSAILAVAAFWPARSIATARLSGLAPGATVYLAVVAMALTSSDRAVAFLGPRRWRLLHTIGAYLVWVAFFAAYAPRAAADIAYAPAALLLMVALALRFVRRPRVA